MGCVQSEEEDLDEGGIPDAEVESDGRAVSLVTGCAGGGVGIRLERPGGPITEGSKTQA